MVGFTIPRAFVSMDPWSGTLLVGMPRGVTLPDGRDVGGYSLRKYADEREKTDWRGEEGIRVTLDDGFRRVSSAAAATTSRRCSWTRPCSPMR